MTDEERKEKNIQDFVPINDVFFEALACEPGVCEEILRTILEDENLIVTDVIAQSSERNIYGRSVRLDALCTLGDGTKCNIEVQRSDNDNHLRRARFNASNITVRSSEPGDAFSDVIDLYVVYISEFDIFKRGKTIYHIEKTIKETAEPVDDGLHEIFVNTKVKDGSNVSDLMSHFLEKEVDDPKFPNLSAAVKRLKTTEGGKNTMCEIMDKYLIEIYIETAREYGAPEEEIVKRLQEKFSISAETAKRAVGQVCSALA